MAKKEVTNDEIMQALNQFANQVNERFDGVDARLDKLESDVSRIYDIIDKHMALLQRWIFQLADKTGVQLKYD